MTEATTHHVDSSTDAGTSLGGLRRTLKARHVVMISLGGIIGAGLFVGSSAAIAATGPAVVISYGIAGALVFLVMRMLGELVVSQSGVSSFTEYTRQPLGNFAAFLTGWLYAYFWVIVVAFEALVGAQMLTGILGLPVWAIALLLLVILTGVNLFSVRGYGEFEFWFASIKVAAVILFILAGLCWLAGIGRVDPAPALSLFSYDAFVPKGAASILGAVPAVIFSICGAEIAAIAAAESTEPGRNVSRLAISVIFRVLFFYLGSVLIIVSIMSWTDVVPGQSPFVAALDRMQVPFASEAMNFIILTAVLSCLNSGIYVTSRILLGLSLQGDAPRRALRTNSAGVPVGGVLFTAVAAYALLLISSLSYEAVFTFLLNASGAIMLLVYFMIAWAQIKSRYAMSPEARAALPVQMWWFPGLSIAVMLAIAAVLVVMTLSSSTQSQVYATAVAVAVVAVAYLLRRAGTPLGGSRETARAGS